MTAILKRIDDPRDALDRARRPELVAFAKANGLAGIHENVPAILIRKQLRSLRLTNIKVAMRPLGSPPDMPAPLAAQAGAPLVEAEGQTVDAADDLERQFRAETPKPQRAPLEINVLRAEMRRLGIKAERRDNIIVMRAKIKAHGQQIAP